MATDTQKPQWTLKRLLEWTTEYFQKAGVEQGRLCAEILLSETLGCQRIELYTRFDYCPTEEQLGPYRAWVKRCAQHEPVAYLIGKAHFYSLQFKVTPAVLIPRPETELLVTEALDFARKETQRPTVDVLDIGTGSGCIAVALAHHCVEMNIVAVDVCAEALEVARQNVTDHELLERIHLLQSDLFENLEQAPTALFDLIVSNPPYINAADYAELEKNVRDHEPRTALLGGADGMDTIRRIVAQAEPYLADGGLLLLEVAYDQGEKVMELCRQQDYLDQVDARKDDQGHWRIVRARRA